MSGSGFPRTLPPPPSHRTALALLVLTALLCFLCMIASFNIEKGVKGKYGKIPMPPQPKAKAQELFGDNVQYYADAYPEHKLSSLKPE